MDPLMVEGLAARESFQLAMELGLDNIIMEGDSQQLIRLIQRRGEHQIIWVVISDITRLLDGFSTAETCFVRRSGNGTTHSIAQKAVLRFWYLGGYAFFVASLFPSRGWMPVIVLFLILPSSIKLSSIILTLKKRRGLMLHQVIIVSNKTNLCS